MDLAEGHLAALRNMVRRASGGKANGFGKYSVYNLGSGIGYSVLEMLKAMEEACGHALKYEIGARREGDIAVCYADPTKAREELGWEAKRNLSEMCRDLWKWQSTNPNGFSKK